MTNEELNQEYLDIMAQFDGDVAGRRHARDYMAHSTAIVHHRVVEASCMPKLLNKESYETLKRTSETAHAILCKVMQRYLDDPEYRKCFDFDPRLEELILLPRGYSDMLPFARVDTFLDEENQTLKFCEFNGDGSSGMNENREINNSIRETASYQEFAKRHELKECSLFDPWVEKFIGIYEGYEHRVDNPRFAICDYLENGVVDEFHLYAQCFRDHGYDCIVEDVRNLRFDGDVLRASDGEPVNAIWRRCVTNDVIDYWDESQDLINAVRNERVALIGSFAGHIVHDKQIFKVLFMPETDAFLTAEEQQFVRDTVPYTAFLMSDVVDVEAIKANKNDWIIKPSDHYGADNVYAGCAQTQERWEELVEAFRDNREGYPFIVQTYVTPHKTLILPPDADIENKTDSEVVLNPEPYNNLNGLYLFNGTFSGIFSRLGPLPTISKDMKGITAATVFVWE